MAKRIMFLYYILSRPEDELLSQVFHAQMENPVRNDWVLQVQKDLQDIGLGYLSMQDIKSQSKESFKSLVKESCAKLAFSNLMKEKEGLSKMNNLTYGKLEMQEYLSTDKLNSQQKRLLYRIRTRTIDTPDSYGRNTLCSLCNLARDEISHVIDCVVIKLACPDIYLSESVRIDDAYQQSDLEHVLHSPH